MPGCMASNAVPLLKTIRSILGAIGLPRTVSRLRRNRLRESQI